MNVRGERTRRLTSWRWVAASAAAAAVLVLLAIVVAGASAWPKDVTDASRYAAVLAEVGHPTPRAIKVPSLAHFPAAVPADATRVRFFYRPGFLQAGTILQLRCGLPPDAIRQLVSQHEPVAKAAYRGGSRFAGVNAGAGGLPAAMFRDAANAGFADLPDDFRTFVLDAKDLSPGTWHHGWSYGVSVSEQRGEVILWADDW